MLFKKLSDVSETELQKILSRGSGLENVAKTVSAVLLDVRIKGDAAVREYTLKFDKVELSDFEVKKSLRKLFPALIRNFWITLNPQLQTSGLFMKLNCLSLPGSWNLNPELFWVKKQHLWKV
jgi:hypothetical protein